uniref:NADH-ubiquinone oxidoreductase chain 4L n=1 Tax=Spilopyra sumptuosa TaxID=284356 RepID=U3L0F4_9CUCU|nr:NADH dehydrogenase subunit 4L [Spilopyra sumptuosa]QUB07185.1 NADH dehydrogenase subunit 4L [Spilopyra sumptuosa]
MMMLYFMSIMFFLTGLMVFTFKRSNLLLMLLSLEFIVVSLYWNIYLNLMMMQCEFYFSMIFLSMSVCEGVLGLSVLVSMIRGFGNDQMLSFTLLW